MASEDLGRPFRLTSGSMAFMGRNQHQEQCFTGLELCEMPTSYVDEKLLLSATASPEKENSA